MRFHDPDLAAQHTGLLDGLVARLRERYVWEDVACALCGPNASSSYATTKHGIDLRTCDACGHLYVSPRLPEEAVTELYGSAYWDDHAKAVGSPTLAERVAFDYQNGFGKLARDVQPYRRQGRLLDVGASNGGMVRAAREQGYVASGIEPSPDICALSERENGVELICGDLRTADLPPESLEIVTMHDVLEHLFDPIGTLRACREVLATGGLLVVETPTTDSLERHLRGDAWSQLNPLAHVNLFSEANLVRALTSNGFRLLDCYCPHENNVIVVGEAI